MDAGALAAWRDVAAARAWKDYAERSPGSARFLKMAESVTA
jgi:hypothetical protein